MLAVPAGWGMWEYDPAAHEALFAAWPREYVVTFGGYASRVDPRWTALATALGESLPGKMLSATVFCHERRTPDGRRRLVVVEGLGWKCRVIGPATWPVGDGPRVVWRDEADADATAREALDTTMSLSGARRVNAGIADLADPARFTVPFVWNGVSGTYEYRLGNDDRVTIRLLDPEGFIAHANRAKVNAAKENAAKENAAKSRAATQPAQ